MFEPLVDPKIVETVEKINKMVHQVNVELLHFWLNEIVFEWHWWVGIGLSILPWIFWLRVRKRESTHLLLYGGFVVLIIASYLDCIGLSFELWDYNYKVFPIIQPFFPWDFTLLPVTTMLFYQFKPKINPYIKAIVFSAFASFVVQPVFHWLGFYNPKEWKHYYSFPIIIVIYLIGYYFSTRKSFKKI